MKKIMYKWIVLENGKIVDFGILDEPVDIFVEEIFPKANSNADRYINDLQDYADEYLSEFNYDFRWKEIDVDFSDLMKGKNE